MKALLSPVIALVFSIFLDSFALGLVTAILPPLLLDQTPASLLEIEASSSLRGALFGCLGLMFTLGQLFSSPLLGDLSEHKGIKKVLYPVLVAMAISYGIGAVGTLEKSMALLLASQFLRGCATGSRTILQLYAVNIDQNKIKNIGWLGVGTGLGLILGPYTGSLLMLLQSSSVRYAYPFLLATLVTCANVQFIKKWLPSITTDKANEHWSIGKGLRHLKKALFCRNLRPLFAIILCYFIGWEMFYSLGPVFLMKKLQFAPCDVGLFYAFIGIWMIIGNGVLVRLTMRFSSISVLKYTLPLWGLTLLGIAFFHNKTMLWSLLPLLPCLGGVITATMTALFTDLVEKEMRGEVLGIFQSLQSAAAGATFIAVSSLAANYPSLPIVGGAFFLFLASYLWLRQSPGIAKTLHPTIP